MTTEELIIDTIEEMKKRNVKPSFSDFEALVELMEEEQLTKEEINNDTIGTNRKSTGSAKTSW